MIATITIPGEPISKHRPRFATRIKKLPGGKIRAFSMAYSDQESEESKFMWHLSNQWKRDPIPKRFTVELHLQFLMPIPKTSKKKHDLMVSGEIGHNGKPDLDNLIKFIKDCSRGIIYDDDSQVSHVTSSKVYSDTPKTVIEVVQTGIGFR
jgi:Holliday junction resolvase RusA-like endonuclease